MAGLQPFSATLYFSILKTAESGRVNTSMKSLLLKIHRQYFIIYNALLTVFSSTQKQFQ